MSTIRFNPALVLSACLAAAPLSHGQMAADTTLLREKLHDITASLQLDRSHRLQARGRIAAYVRGDSLHLWSMQNACRPSHCAGCIQVLGQKAATLPLPGKPSVRPPAFLLVSAGDPFGPRWAADVAIAREDGLVYGGRILSDNQELTVDWDSLALDLRKGQRPELVASGQEAGITVGVETGEKTLIVSGTGRLLRLVRWTTAGLRARPGDIYADEDIVAGGTRGISGMVHFAGADGGIFAWTGGEIPQRMDMTQQTRPLLVEGDAVLYRDSLTVRYGPHPWTTDIGWVAYPVPRGEYRGFRLEARPEGLGVRLYPVGGNPTWVRLGDTPTRLAVNRIGVPVTSNGMGWPGPFRGEPDSLRVGVFDPEGNTGPLTVRMHRPDSRVDLVPAMRRKAPGSAGCVAPGLCMAALPDTLLAVVGEDSVILHLPVLRTRDPIGMECGPVTVREVLQTSQSWRLGDSLVVAVGSQYVAIHREVPIGIGTRRVPASPRPVRGTLVLDRRGGLTGWPEGLSAGPYARAEFRRPDGRTLGTFAPGESLAGLPAGPAWIHWPGPDRKARPVRVLLR